MKKLKITLTAFLLLSAVLTGCTAEKKNYMTYDVIQENASAYRGKTVHFIKSNRVSGGVDAITNAEGQSLYHDAFGWYGDLPIVEMISRPDLPSEYSIPYSSSFTYTVGDDLVAEGDSFSVADAGYRFSCGAAGTGIQTITISDPNQVEVTGLEEMEFGISGKLLITFEELKMICPPSQYIVGYMPDLFVVGSASKCASVKFTETGAIASGFIGEASIFLDVTKIIERTYTFTGETVEIDIVSQPGEILVTPIEG